MTPAKAHYIIGVAVKQGKLVPYKNCQTCGRDVSKGRLRSRIVAHHWKGYDYPLEVWWICQRCNSHLHDRHDGKMSIEEARQFVNIGKPNQTPAPITPFSFDDLPERVRRLLLDP